MVRGDDWTKSAMRDGEVVAEVLVRLKEGKVRPVLSANPTVAALRWGIRQPRSRKEADSAKNSRCSPSTPLSWSGGCGGSSSSPSAYLDCYEATSRRRITGSFPSLGSRSKVLVTSDLDFGVNRFQTKKDTASLRSPFSERTDIQNMNVKRMKLNTQTSNSLSDCHLAENVDRNTDGNFLLPDLNVMPCEDNGDHFSSLSVETALYGIRIVR